MKWVENNSAMRSNGSARQPCQAAGRSGSPSVCWINGRQFLQRGALWIDRAVENMPQAQRVRIRFDSREYFQLLNRYPKLFARLAGARNVHVAVEDTICEIYE